MTTSHLLTPRPEKLLQPGLGDPFRIPREDTCEKILKRLEQSSVVTVRGPPSTGKSYMAGSLELYLHQKPAYSSWTCVYLNAEKIFHALLGEEGKESKSVESWLDEELKAIRDGWRDNPNLIIIIDEGHITYLDKTFWHLLKDYHKSGKRTKFLLLCAWGWATEYPFDLEFGGTAPMLTDA